MSKKEDILDGNLKDLNKKKYGLIYTCNLGWVDLGHANPASATGLWLEIKSERGKKSSDGKGFQVTYGQTMSKFKMSAGFTGTYYVKTGLSMADKESVALAIFMEVSSGFETLQSSFPYNLTTDSGFSAEDLISDLLGFYRALRPSFDYLFLSQPVSKTAAEKIWDDNGAVGTNKNQSFNPFLYPCSECSNSPKGGISAILPSWLNTIKPAKKGGLFRNWNPSQDEGVKKPSGASGSW
jgi:hypothetical protein